MIISPILFMVYLLKDRVKLNDNVVPVIKKIYPLDKTPCITLNDTSSKVLKQYMTYTDGVECKVIERNITVQINIWCNNEKDRESIITQINNIFEKTLTDHYELCLNYNKTDNSCSTLSTTCKALTKDNARSIKNKCPKPTDYDYLNVWKNFNIERFTFEYNNPNTLDELDMKPPLLHSSIDTNMNYKTYYTTGGILLDNIKISDDLL